MEFEVLPTVLPWVKFNPLFEQPGPEYYIHQRDRRADDSNGIQTRDLVVTARPRCFPTLHFMLQFNCISYSVPPSPSFPLSHPLNPTNREQTS